MSNKNNKVEEEKPKKLAFYISFKQSEEQLYKDMKAVDDYSNVLKGLMREYLYGKKDTTEESRTDDRSMVVTIDDICKILSSVNPVVAAAAPVGVAPVEGVPTEDENNKNNDEGVENVITDPIPTDMINSL